MFDPKPFLANVSQRPGVYRMLGADGEVLYVGKARNLKNRLTSYFVGKAQTAKTMAMVSQIENIEVTVTGSETEALLLEYNLIKRHRPRFNVPPHGVLGLADVLQPAAGDELPQHDRHLELRERATEAAAHAAA